MDAPRESASIQLRRRLAHLAMALRPLLSVTTGEAHPAFPRTLLHFHILTAAQLDDLARFYHQRSPSVWSWAYPAPVVTRWARDADVAAKRRRFGRFVGLRGCDSPVMMDADAAAAHEAAGFAAVLERWMEAAMRRGMEREMEKKIWRQKGF